MADDKQLLEEEEEIVADPNNPESGDVIPDGTTVGGVNSVTTGIGSTAQPIMGVPLYKGPMGDFATWMNENGYDPDKDYADAKAALEYDYETSMATYGQKAEKLSQMGLSNSGVSDIYQLNAFNSYLQNQNTLANQLIAAKKKYKQEYNALFEEREGYKKTDSANAYNFGLSLYDGTNIEFVKQQLIHRGYDASIVDSTVASLTALDVNTLPAVKAQKNQDDSDINNAFAALNSTYSADKQGSIEAYYRSQGWSEDKIARLISGLNAYTGIAGTEEKDKVVEKFVADIKSQEAFKDYKGSEQEKLAVKNYLDSLGYGDYYDQVIAGLGTAAKEEADAVVTDMVNKPTGEVTTDELEETLDKADEAYGTDSEEYREIKETVSEKGIELFEWALESDGNGVPVRLGTSEVAAALGFDSGSWANMDDGSRERAIMDYAGEMHKNGSLSDLKYNDFVSNWIKSELGEESSLSDASMVAYTLTEWEDSGYLSQDDYSKMIGSIAGIMNFSFSDIADGKISWNGDYGEIELQSEKYTDTDKVSNTELADEIQTAFNNSARFDQFVSLRKRGYSGNIALYAYQGNLYEVIYTYDKNGDPVASAVYQSDPSRLKIIRTTQTTNTDTEKEGVYALIAYALDYKLHKLGGNSGALNLGGAGKNQISTRQ